ncbi:hypothetical protein FRC10_005119 [Ceratobasidium sp. 414]|nr:hypothetical protein FRC10_005119 [Ceratobasidium sp. 414]
MASPATTTTHASTRSREEMVSAARKKLKTFRAKQAHSPMSSSGNHAHRRSHSRGSSMNSATEFDPSAPVASEATKHQKRRSHSRSASILDPNTDNGLHSVPLPSLTFKNQPESFPTNLGGLNRSFSFGGSKSRPASAIPAMLPMPTSPVRVHHQQNPSRSRPSSHHRRRSSVSTRRDSVDMMGFDPASLKSVGENDKDDVAKVRERALLALEGKAPRPGKARTVPEILPHLGFSKVEIPEWRTPDVERSFDWAMSNNAKPIPFSLGPNGALAGKRDSFGKALVPSVPTKAELAVLVEEEEEDEPVDANKEDMTTTRTPVPASVPEPVIVPVVESPTAESHPSRAISPSRPRPASLNLKALALAASATVALPTPSATPSPTPPPRSLPGMKPLNLGSTTRRQSMIALGSSSRNSLPLSRRQSLRSESRGSDSPRSSRDSVINRLPPTPNTTSPTSMNSTAGIEGFLQKNQEVLISRIEQLERALAKSQRMSVASDASSGTTSSLAEDQITLLAELRNERNALVEEVAGWRTRVEDLERQAALYTKRVESERHECSVVRERVHELEVEQRAWEAGRLVQEKIIARARDDAAVWRAKYEEASKGECHWQAKAVNLESDVRRLEMELAAARRQTGPVTPPNKRWNVPMASRRFDGSVSSASTTDVDETTSYGSGDMDAWKMKPRVPSPLPNMDVVVEEEEEVYEGSYEEPSLDEDEDEESHCVEEDEDDVASDILDEVNGELSASCSMGSFSSPNSQRTETQPASSRSELFAFPPPAPPAPAPSHARTGSMVQGWQMPRGPVAVNRHSFTKPDRFFDQLEHLYASSEEDLPPANLPSPELGTFKGDGGASAFTFGTRRSTVMGSIRGHGTRASRASISLGAFDGLGLPPFMNPKPEWIVKSESAEPVALVSPATMADVAPVSVSLKNKAQNKSGVDDSRAASRVSVYEARAGADSVAHSSPGSDSTPKMAKPPTFTPAPTTSTTPTRSLSNARTLARRKPSLTRAQPTGRAPPRVPLDPSYDNKPRSPFSVSYSRTSSRSSKSRLSIAETEAIEAAIEQARTQALAQQQSRLTLAGLTSLIPWGRGTSGVAKSAPVCDEERAGQRPLVAGKESGTVTREVQLARLRREMQAGKTLSGPCCSRCKSDLIQL